MIFPLLFYGRFLRTRMIKAPIIATKTNSPAIAGMKYWSATDGAVIGAGASVGCASTTLNAVVSVDGQ
jgi:hypothetical protein